MFRDFGLALQLFRIESERLKLPAPFGRLRSRMIATGFGTEGRSAGRAIRTPPMPEEIFRLKPEKR